MYNVCKIWSLVHWNWLYYNFTFIFLWLQIKMQFAIVCVLWILWSLILIFCKCGFLLFEWRTDVTYLCEMYPMFLLYLAFRSPTNVLFNQRVKFLFVYVAFYFLWSKAVILQYLKLSSTWGCQKVWNVTFSEQKIQQTAVVVSVRVTSKAQPPLL